MKIQSVCIRNCKRFRTSDIKEISFTCPAPVQIITAPNWHGKSSLLRELCPLPPVRSLYESNGYKEIHYLHNNHKFVLISDFRNKNAPHSFQMDGKELNISGTTDIQEELVSTYFGITPAIRSLIYNKVTLCSATKSERKNLFLTINPMHLGVIVDAHKKVLSKIKDCKANLQHLYARKADIESKMLKPDILNQHVHTKKVLTDQVNQTDNLIVQLEQHILTLKHTHDTDIQYYNSNKEKHIPLFPVKEVMYECKNILHRVYKYTCIDRDNYLQQLNQYTALRSQKQYQKKEIEQQILTLTKEVNEYNLHFDTANKRPVNKIEQEILEITAELKKYPEQISNPIPEDQISEREYMINQIKDLLFIFRDLPVPLLTESEYNQKKQQYQTYRSNLQIIKSETDALIKFIEENKKELQVNAEKADIPDTCVFNQCGLKKLFSRRNKNIEISILEKQKQLNVCINKQKEYQKKYDELDHQLKDLIQSDAYTRYHTLLNILQYKFPLEDWNITLIDKLNTQPLMILKCISDYIEQSRMYYTCKKLQQKKQLLVKELETMIKTSGISSDFLKNKIKEKEEIIRQKITNVSELDKEIASVEAMYLLCMQYKEDVGKISDYQNMLNTGTRALIIVNAISYWNKLKEYLIDAKNMLSEELRQIETIVREQTLLHHTFDTEIITQINKYTKNKDLYTKLEFALSPTTGLPHNSMVKYLNILIHNVNYFISQVWSYKLCILPLSEDEPIDYTFKIDVAGNITNDISDLSDGQTEIVNLSWVLAILLQMKLLNTIPFFADELGRALDNTHRNALLRFLGQLIDHKFIEQLFLVNHYAVFTDGFKESNVICLNKEEMSDLPGTINEYVKLK